MSPTVDTPGARYASALTALRRAGVATATNVRRSRRRVRATDLHMKYNAEPHAFTLGRREAVKWKNASTALDWRGRPATTVVWYHGNSAGPLVVSAFEEAGFRTTWSGDPTTALAVHLS